MNPKPLVSLSLSLFLPQGTSSSKRQSRGKASQAQRWEAAQQISPPPTPHTSGVLLVNDAWGRP